MFKWDDFRKELLADNPTYERVLKSDLHDLHEILSKVFPAFTAEGVAAEMKRIKATKWTKYRRTRAYLERSIPLLKKLLIPKPIDFGTAKFTNNADGTITHKVQWKSDTGTPKDLGKCWTRESIRWPQWDKAVTDCIGDDFKTYRQAGSHHGMKPNPAWDPGNGNSCDDTHALMGPLSGKVLNFKGPGTLVASMDQTYEWSQDKVTWHKFPNSSYTIVRTISAVGNKVKVELKKTNKNKPGDTCTNSKLL